MLVRTFHIIHKLCDIIFNQMAINLRKDSFSNNFLCKYDTKFDQNLIPNYSSKAVKQFKEIIISLLNYTRVDNKLGVMSRT